MSCSSIHALSASRSRRYASMVARLRPFSMVSHCRQSSSRGLRLVKKGPKDPVKRDGGRGINRRRAPERLFESLRRKPDDAGTAFFGSGRSPLTLDDAAGLVDGHYLRRPSRRVHEITQQRPLLGLTPHLLEEFTLGGF